MPCSNGYEYAQMGYDFNPIIINELAIIENFTVRPFPYKKMKGAGYQGVFDKRYSKSIIENSDADILIFSRFIGNHLEPQKTNQIWGYEVKILNTKTLEQRSSIKSTNFTDYNSMEENLRKNIFKLTKDIENII